LPFSTIEKAVAAIGRGEIVVVVDDEDRENEGDLIMAAGCATAEKIAFFVKHTSGLICAPITNERADELDLQLMVSRNTESQRTAFTVTVDYRHGTTTGISASDRAMTIRSLIDPATRPGDLTRPGHIHVLRARDGGVLKRAGHTEAAVDLARMAGLYPAGVLCELVTEDGMGMARLPELERFAKQHDLSLISIAELIRYRRQREKLVRRMAEARIPTQWGEFTCYAYQSLLDGETHLAFVMGAPQGQDNVLVRVHSECLTGDVFGSLKCDCGPQLREALRIIGAAGGGVLLYLRQEGRGIGLANKLRAYALQDRGLDTVDANRRLGFADDERDYVHAAAILRALGIAEVRLLTNNPNKVSGLEAAGIRVAERVAHHMPANPHNADYLATKRKKSGHLA